MHVFFYYHDKPRYGELRKPKNPTKLGQRLGGTVTDGMICISVDGTAYNVLQMQDIKLSEGVIEFKFGDRYIFGPVQPGNTDSLILTDDGVLLLEVVSVYPKTYNVHDIKLLQTSESSFEAEYNRIQSEMAGE